MFKGYVKRYNTRIGQDGLFYITCLGLMKEFIGIDRKLFAVDSTAYDGRFVFEDYNAEVIEGFADEEPDQISFSEITMDYMNGDLHGGYSRDTIPHLDDMEKVISVICYPEELAVYSTTKESRTGRAYKTLRLGEVKETEDRLDKLGRIGVNKVVAKRHGYNDFVGILSKLIDECDVTAK
jgi:hypothetical protein